MAYKPQAGAQMAAPNVIPMADIMLVLLIIFMVVTPMLQKTHQVDLAPTNNPHDMKDADKDDAIVVAISRDGSIFLGNAKLRKEEITDQVKDRISNRLDKTVYVKSDARAKYGDVVAVVDEIRSAGVDQLANNGKLKINQEDTTWDRLGPRMEEIFKERAEKIAFVKGDNDVMFMDVARAIDIMRGAGIDKIGLITAKLEAGQ